MAKKTDHFAGGMETDDSGAVLSGLLAEEGDLDRRALWRIGSWGVGAVAAVVVAVMANQTSLGWKRDQLASADLNRQAQQMQVVARETQNEARRLASAIETLNGDRDRLYTRVTTLEHGLDSVTGAIARQGSTALATPTPLTATGSQAAQTPSPAVSPVATRQPIPSTADKPAAAAPTEPNPAAVSSVAKESAKTEIPKIESRKAEATKVETARAEPAKPEIAKTETGKTETAKADGAKTATAKSDAAKTDTARIDSARIDVAKTPEGIPATPLIASKSILSPPDPAAAKLIDPAKPLSPVTAAPIPEVMASAPANDADADDEAAPKVAVQRTQFGVDLGTANSVAGLRGLWRGLLKSRSNAPLTALRPIIVIREGANGLGMQLRLVAGPLNDAGAAARICAVLAENKRSCETAIYDGQRLAVTGDDPAPAPAASKPPPRRRGAVNRAAVVEELPKKPETSATGAISSWLGRRTQ